MLWNLQLYNELWVKECGIFEGQNTLWPSYIFQVGQDPPNLRIYTPAYICQMPGHRLSRLAKGTPSESRLDHRTIGLG